MAKKESKLRVFAVFDKDGICITVVRLGDPTASPNINGKLVEITNGSVAHKIEARKYKKIGNRIFRRSDKEIEKDEEVGMMLKSK